jgi:hypothetical protein
MARTATDRDTVQTGPGAKRRARSPIAWQSFRRYA